MGRGGGMRRILLGVALASIFGTPARAGAWLAPEGGQEIWTNAAGVRDELTVIETSAYWEAPFGDQYSVVAAPWIEQAADMEDGWRGEAVIGVKRAMFRDGANVMALQAGAFWRSDPPHGCGEGGAELRWLGGRAMGETAFVNLEAAARALDGGCFGARADLTLGYRPRDNWLALGEVFLDAPDQGEDSLKLQFSLARFDSEGGAVQLGVRARLDGDDPEPALILGFWGRPGD
jgi:hypothetical protein